MAKYNNDKKRPDWLYENPTPEEINQADESLKGPSLGDSLKSAVGHAIVGAEDLMSDFGRPEYISREDWQKQIDNQGGIHGVVRNAGQGLVDSGDKYSANLEPWSSGWFRHNIITSLGNTAPLLAGTAIAMRSGNAQAIEQGGANAFSRLFPNATRYSGLAGELSKTGSIGAVTQAPEATMEDREAYNMAINDGKSPQQAEEIAKKVKQANMLLLTGTNTAENMLAFSKTLPGISKYIPAGMAGRLARLGLASVMEGPVEEGGQSIIQDTSANKPINMEQFAQNSALGAVQGGMFNAGGQLLQAKFDQNSRPTAEQIQEQADTNRVGQQVVDNQGAPPVNNAGTDNGSPAPEANTADAYIREASQKYGVNENLIRAVIQAESSFNPDAQSPVGALGYMQLMPETAAGLGVNPNDPRENIMGGTQYLRQQLDAFGGDVSKALAAYNAGPGAVQEHNGIPPYAETQNYVAKIMASMNGEGGISGQQQPQGQAQAQPTVQVGQISNMNAGQIRALAEQSLMPRLQQIRQEAVEAKDTQTVRDVSVAILGVQNDIQNRSVNGTNYDFTKAMAERYMPEAFQAQQAPQEAQPNTGTEAAPIAQPELIDISQHPFSQSNPRSAFGFGKYVQQALKNEKVNQIKFTPSEDNGANESRLDFARQIASQNGMQIGEPIRGKNSWVAPIVRESSNANQNIDQSATTTQENPISNSTINAPQSQENTATPNRSVLTTNEYGDIQVLNQAELNPEHQNIQRIGKMLGANVKFIAGNNAPNGLYISESGKASDSQSIYVNADPKAKPMFWVLGHEFSHFILDNRPTLANKLMSGISDEQAIAYAKQLQGKGVSRQYDTTKPKQIAHLKQEIISDTIANGWLKPEFWQGIQSTQPKSVLNALIDLANKYIAKVKNTLMRNGKQFKGQDLLAGTDRALTQETIASIESEFQKAIANVKYGRAVSNNSAGINPFTGRPNVTTAPQGMKIEERTPTVDKTAQSIFGADEQSQAQGKRFIDAVNSVYHSLGTPSVGELKSALLKNPDIVSSFGQKYIGNFAGDIHGLIKKGKIAPPQNVTTLPNQAPVERKAETGTVAKADNKNSAEANVGANKRKFRIAGEGVQENINYNDDPALERLYDPMEESFRSTHDKNQESETDSGRRYEGYDSVLHQTDITGKREMVPVGMSEEVVADPLAPDVKSVKVDKSRTVEGEPITLSNGKNAFVYGENGKYKVYDAKTGYPIVDKASGKVAEGSSRKEAIDSATSIVNTPSKSDSNGNLFQRIRNKDNSAKESIVRKFKGMVTKLANSYHEKLTDDQKGLLTADDLYQEGVIGLMNASEKYKGSSMDSFVPFAQKGVTMAIRDAMDKTAHKVKISSGMIDNIANYKKAFDAYVQKNGQEPTNAQMAVAMGKSTDQIRAIIDAINIEKGGSLDQSVSNKDGDSGTTMGELIQDKSSERSQSRLNEALNKAIETKLTPDEQAVVRARYRFGEQTKAEKPATYETVGTKLGITPAQAEALDKSALEKLNVVKLASKTFRDTTKQFEGKEEKSKPVDKDKKAGEVKTMKISDKIAQLEALNKDGSLTDEINMLKNIANNKGKITSTHEFASEDLRNNEDGQSLVRKLATRAKKKLSGKVDGVREKLPQQKDFAMKGMNGKIEEWLASPSYIASKYKEFAGIYNLGYSSYKLESRLKTKFKNHLDHIYNNVLGNKEEDLTMLNKLRTISDAQGWDVIETNSKAKKPSSAVVYSDQKLKEMGVGENVIKAFRGLRNNYEMLHRATNSIRKNMGQEGMGHLGGYVPHFFENFKITTAGEKGRRSTYTTVKTLAEARKIAKDLKSKGYQELEISFLRSEYGGQAGQNAFIEDELTPDESRDLNDVLKLSEVDLEGDIQSLVSKIEAESTNHRFLGHALHRKGAKGWTENLRNVDYSYSNRTARYIALEPFKTKAIAAWEGIFGAGEKGSFKSKNLPHVEDALARYSRQYILDINGNPTQAEEFLTRMIEMVPGLHQWMGSHFGDRWALQAVNATTEFTTAVKLGFWNASTGVMQLTQLMNVNSLVESKYVAKALPRAMKIAYYDVVLGKDITTPRERRILKLAGEHSDFTNQSGYATPGGMSYFKGIRKLSQKSLVAFRWGDSMTRKTAILSAYNEEMARSGDESKAISYARGVDRKANFDYSVVDAPKLFRSLGPIGQILLQFKKYAVKEGEFLIHLAKEGNALKNAKFWLPYLAISGLNGIPFWEVLKGLGKDLFDKDIDAEIKSYAIENSRDPWSRGLAQTAFYGGFSMLPGGLGFDISKRAGLGDVMPTGIKSLAPSINTFYNAWKVANDNQWDVTRVLPEMVKAISPGIGNYAQAITGEARSTSDRGRLNIEYTPNERIIRALGFVPIREATSRDSSYLIKYNEQAHKDKVTAAKDAYLYEPTKENYQKLVDLGVNTKTLKKQLADEAKTKNTERVDRALDNVSKKRKELYTPYKEFSGDE